MKRPLVALSVGDAPEQSQLGFGKEHLTEALVRLARLLLRSGCDLVYGGDLRQGGFTELLMRLVRAENDGGALGGARARRSRELRRLVNFLSWPKFGGLTPDVQAVYLGVARFVRVWPPGEHGTLNPGLGVDDDVRVALALSAMRRAVAEGTAEDVDGKKVPPSSAQLVLGGKVTGYSGLMPGILEEVAFAAVAGGRRARPLFVLGGFGGAAAALARGLLAGRPTEECTLAWQEERRRGRPGGERPPLLQRAFDAGPYRKHRAAFHPEHRYAALQALCEQGVAGLCRRNGLDAADNETLLRTSDVTEVLAVLRRAPLLAQR